MHFEGRIYIFVTNTIKTGMSEPVVSGSMPMPNEFYQKIRKEVTFPLKIIRSFTLQSMFGCCPG
jgi:hypothetical protein